MEDQVLSISQMKELKDLGIDISKASCYWGYFPFDNSELYVSFYSNFSSLLTEEIPTFTLQDIIKLLPEYIDNGDNGGAILEINNHEIVYSRYSYGEYSGRFSPMSSCGTDLLKSAFELLKWCIKNKYIKL